MSKLEPLIEILAFFSAMRNYGYIDRLSNSLDEVTAYEALKDAMRDYLSQCVDRRDKCVEVDRETKLLCPDVNPDDLREAVNTFMAKIKDQPGDVIVKETRRLALMALSRKVKAMERRC